MSTLDQDYEPVTIDDGDDIGSNRSTQPAAARDRARRG